MAHVRQNVGFSLLWNSQYPSLGNLALNRVINMFIIGGLQIGTIYAKNYGQFLAVRALFGIGVYFILLGA
jgi:hypothetical protein